MNVDITVTWTRSGPTASGDTTITTHVYATNPAHRTITVQATDNIYQGTGQAPADLLDTGRVAGRRGGRLRGHARPDAQFAYSGDATSFNDVATATYTDLITGIPVPGQTRPPRRQRRSRRAQASRTLRSS